MRTLYYHAGAGAAAAARGLGVQSLEYSLRRMRGGSGAVQRACLAHASAR